MDHCRPATHAQTPSGESQEFCMASGRSTKGWKRPGGGKKLGEEVREPSQPYGQLTLSIENSQKNREKPWKAMRTGDTPGPYLS